MILKLVSSVLLSFIILSSTLVLEHYSVVVAVEAYSVKTKGTIANNMSSSSSPTPSSSQNNHHHHHHHQRNLNRPLNKPIIIGYAHDAKSGKAEQAIEDGAMVIIWSFLHLEFDHVVDDGDASSSSTSSQSQQSTQLHKYPKGKIRTDLDLEKIRSIRDENESVVHLAAFGGWNGPHPPATTSTTSDASISMTGKQWLDVFSEFNQSNGYVFDGIDWDYEGHDDILRSPTSKFTLDTLDIMADFSIEAKKVGYIVAMAPAESYLDSSSAIIDERRPTNGTAVDCGRRFSLRLDLPPRAWTSSPRASDADRASVRSAGFSHAGRQCYAYVLARAGVDAFDWISIQLYEAYSPFAHDVHRRGMDAADAIMVRVRSLAEGYTVSELPLLLDNDSFTSTSTSSSSSSPLSKVEYQVKVPPSKLVVGIANGWADGMKFCKVEPSAVRSAYESTLAEYGEGFLGVMFWTIEEEGKDDGDDNSRLTHSLRSEFENIGLQQLSGEL